MDEEFNMYPIFHKNIIVLIAGSLLLFSCSSKRYFTQEIADTYNLTPDKMKKVQFYVDNPFVMHRLDQRIDRSIADMHILKTSTLKHTEEYRMEKGTPGVAVSSGNGWINIMFGDSIICKFNRSKYDTVIGGYTFELASINEQPVTQGGQIDFKNAEFELIFKPSENSELGFLLPWLLFRERGSAKHTKQVHKIKGVKL